MAAEQEDLEALTFEALREQCTVLDRRIRTGEAAVGDYGRLARLWRELTRRMGELREQ